MTSDDKRYENAIADLERAGVSIYKIAQIMSERGIRTQYIQVQRWAQGTIPLHPHGEELLKLRSEYADAPRGAIV